MKPIHNNPTFTLPSTRIVATCTSISFEFCFLFGGRRAVIYVNDFLLLFELIPKFCSYSRTGFGLMPNIWYEAKVQIESKQKCNAGCYFRVTFAGGETNISIIDILRVVNRHTHGKRQCIPHIWRQEESVKPVDKCVVC